jgi:hypothetical protein
MEKALTAVLVIAVGIILVYYGKELIGTGRRMLGA